MKMETPPTTNSMNRSPVRLGFLLNGNFRDPRFDGSTARPENPARKFLNEKKAKMKEPSTLISWGFLLVEYHKKPEYQAALQSSPK
jgi:hypothetical protein